MRGKADWMENRHCYHGGLIFEQGVLHYDKIAYFEKGVLTSLTDSIDPDVPSVNLKGDILCLGYADLQVNGGDGIMLGDLPTVEGLTRIATAHRSLGANLILPTLITDTPEITKAVIHAAIDAVRLGVPGVAGLHLEGPHLSIARKGAHDPDLVRKMSDDDLQMLIEAARHLPVLKVTIAPENVTTQQVRNLADTGVLVSLGHTNADFDTALEYIEAGARCVTHLFNAMSPLTSRAPGVVGAALSSGAVSAGVIADGIHVHPHSLGTAWRAKQGPGSLFLVSDAMAVAGSSATKFSLGQRDIHRHKGRLTLMDGTLAGADLDLTTALRVVTQEVGVPLATALSAAIETPRRLIKQPISMLGQNIESFNRLRPDLRRCDALTSHTT
ncbi:N-acetylglucosamine-6-phosphate deacetylase [Epibacterium ulvae]|uniref:N-acetylglucosamine-6-phosphate deacetylase n=1 Tax=Epibacterium ulvae TaxID=1156985 RepID=UPI0024904AB8|nr:N-acetylglucosamine-6-phosphate deacetylase [Epibacterium ulvae]